MRLGLISDTHDKYPTLELALQYFHDQQVELVIHCGDWKSVETAARFAELAAAHRLPVRGVLGNNDFDVGGFLDYARTAPGDFELHEAVYTTPLSADTYLAAYHGHHKPTLRRLVADEACSILLLGHSHKPLIERTGSRLVVNPGSTAFAIPRSKTWRPSVAIVDTVAPAAELAYLG